MREITTKYNSNHRKQRYELIEEPKKQVNKIFISKKLAIKVIMDCRTTSAHKFRTRLGFKQYDFISTKEQPVLIKIISSFERENAGRFIKTLKSKIFKLYIANKI